MDEINIWMWMGLIWSFEALQARSVCIQFPIDRAHRSLCDPMDCSPPGSSVHGILQTRILEWVAMPSSRGSSWARDRTLVSCVSCIASGFFTHWATWEAPLKARIDLWAGCLVFSCLGLKLRLEFIPPTSWFSGSAAYWLQIPGLTVTFLVCISYWFCRLKKKKKKAQHECCKLSFIWGRMRTATQETAPQITLRNCSKGVGEKISIYVILVKAECMKSSTCFAEGFC